ncbi:response regulator transcription factor [Rhizobium sp. BE258]|jgi:two-component system nitrate/nitrite response regulator NarL|uniref:response regulator n=1 Tax=unclassified Rhizobium TaxID=2613769 RepID=UPI000DD56CFA|nr:response regulator transcription factor [Rhizobium sp. BE258]MDR7147633.1 two-component system nitrate/nitrite response regulator NarL [Rhizobium sp. BE258]
MTAITIGIVDDHPLFREGVSRSLSEVADFVVIGEGASSDDAIRLAASDRPCVLLLDVSMPGGGLQTISSVLSRSPETRVLMLTASEEVETLSAALQRGAAGYVLKGIGSRGLAEAIRVVMRGSKFVSPVMSAKVIERSLGAHSSPKASLTPREREVMGLVAEGLSNKHIGLRLDLQEKTVKHHMTQILLKLGVTNRTEAAIKWRDLA